MSAAAAAPKPRGDARAWRVSDRIGLAFAWALGIGFLAVTLAIVGYLMVQGLRYVRP